MQDPKKDAAKPAEAKKDAAKPADAKNAAAKPAAEKQSTPAAGGSSKSTNVVGSVSDSASSSSTDNFNVTSCEQVIMFDGERITDLNNYAKKAPAYFTLSAYSVASFDNKDANKLVEFFDLAGIATVPQQILGAYNCLMFTYKSGGRSMSMCFKDDTMIQKFRDAYNKFEICAKGGNIATMSPSAVQNFSKMTCIFY